MNAKIQIYSVFHPPYLEKIEEILERKEIFAIAGLRRGEEGGLSISFNKKNECLISLRDKKTYSKEYKIFNEAYPQKIENLTTLQKNVSIIHHYLNEKRIPDDLEEKELLQKQLQNTCDLYLYFLKKLKFLF